MFHQIGFASNHNNISLEQIGNAKMKAVTDASKVESKRRKQRRIKAEQEGKEVESASVIEREASKEPNRLCNQS